MNLWLEAIFTLLFIIIGFALIYYLHKKEKI